MTRGKEGIHLGNHLGNYTGMSALNVVRPNGNNIHSSALESMKLMLKHQEVDRKCQKSTFPCWAPATSPASCRFDIVRYCAISTLNESPTYNRSRILITSLLFCCPEDASEALLPPACCYTQGFWNNAFNQNLSEEDADASTGDLDQSCKRKSDRAQLGTAVFKFFTSSNSPGSCCMVGKRNCRDFLEPPKRRISAGEGTIEVERTETERDNWLIDKWRRKLMLRNK